MRIAVCLGLVGFLALIEVGCGGNGEDENADGGTSSSSSSSSSSTGGSVGPIGSSTSLTAISMGTSSGGSSGDTTSSGGSSGGTTSSGGSFGDTTSSGGSSTSHGNPSGSSTSTTHPSSGDTWTFLVYMTADNNLEVAGVADLYEMANVGSAAGLNIIVQVDRAPGESEHDALNLGNFTGTKRVKVEQGSLTQLQDMGEVNMGDPAALTDFVTWGIQNYRADRYAIVLWDHGGAWSGFGWDDSSNNDHLPLPEITRALRDGLQATSTPQFALIGFDACLMATVETIKAVQDLGEYLLSSEEVEPGHGWDYRRLSAVKTNPKLGPRELAHELLAGFKDQAVEERTAPTITLSIVDLLAARGFLDAVDGFTAAMDANNVAKAPAIGQQLVKTRAFGEAKDPAAAQHMVDVGHLAKLLAAADSSFSESLTRINAGLSSVVLENHCGAARDGCTGIAIYFPAKSAYYTEAYGQVAGMDQWRTFLSHYYTAGSTVGADPGQIPTFTNADHVADTSTDSDGYLLISGNLASGASQLIAVSSGSYGIVDGDKVYMLGAQYAPFNQSVAVLAWDKTVLAISQGEQYMYAYIDIQPAENNLYSATIPFIYVPPASTEQRYVVLYYVYDATEVKQATYYDLTGDAAAELTPEAGSQLWPIVIYVDSTTAKWVFSNDTALDPVADFAFHWVPLEAGTGVYADVTIENFAGKGDYVYVAGTL